MEVEKGVIIREKQKLTIKVYYGFNGQNNYDNHKVLNYVEEIITNCCEKISEMINANRKYKNGELNELIKKLCDFHCLTKVGMFVDIQFYKMEGHNHFKILIVNHDNSPIDKIKDALKEYENLVNEAYQKFCLLKLKILGGINE